MTAFAQVWSFSRDRLSQAHEGLTDAQMAWRQHLEGHCIFEYLFHIAGAEHYWAVKMAGAEEEEKLFSAVRSGFLRDGPFPFAGDDFRREKAEAALEKSREQLVQLIESPSQDQLEMKIESPLGPTITGREGLIRVAQHAAYHTGQIWVLRMDPRFPAG